MISIDGHPPPDPSSSHHHHHHQEQQQISHDHLKIKINSDDYKASVSVSDLDLKSPDAADDLDDTHNNPLPNFSIRDHVFSLRSKDVACNWPFSPKSLQICLRNGVKNLLPPFQPLVLLRDNNRCNLENHLASNEDVVSGFDGKRVEDRSKPVTCDAAKSICELTVRSVSTNSSGSKENYKESNTRSKEKPPASCSSQKKSRLVLKLNSGVEPVDQLEIPPNSFVISETMASKVCPVCKIFSSSSNTTLNAHIDQCLTGEASMKWTDNPKVIVKHRIKPRKTRLMSDIYETAPRCTVEELDRRNGTSWATNSSFPAQEFQFQEEKEEPRLTTTINPEVADNEGDVYIDTDGTKVRILSVPKAGSSDNNGARKLLKGVKGCKIVIGKKKSNFFKAKHHQKFLKLGLNAGKLCSPKPSKSRCPSEIVEQIRSSEKEDVTMAEDCRKEEGGREPMKAPAGLAIIRPPWACSKRTGLGKKFSGKQRKMELRKDFLVESEKSSSGCDFRTPISSNKMDSSQIRKKTRTSLPLTKPSLKLLRQEDDDSSGSRDSYPSQHSDGPEIRPMMNTKFSSLRKNLSFSASKTSLKRKFSAFKKSHVVRCLPNEKSVDGSSQNSPKGQSKTEDDDTGARKERSITSKSSNGDQSSVGIETTIEDALRDVESVRNENQPDGDQVCAVPASRMIDDDRNLMDLSNSFDPEFSKLVSDDKLYPDQICSTNRAPDGKNIFGNDIEDGTEDIEKNQDYFQEVDPIPIPGPPGSFLPSPGGDMVSDEIQPIRVPPSENPHNLDTIDRDSMSNSPVSTVSNPSMARSDSRSSEKLSYRSSSVQDDQRPGFSSVMIEPTFKKSFPNSGGAGGGGDWRPVDHIEKGPSPTSFKNDQPCCCSRKETVSSYSVASHYQDSSSLRKQQSIEPSRSPNGLNFRSESMFLLNNYPNSQPPDTMVFPTITKKLSSAAGLPVKLPIYSDCDSAVSPSKPVLRLMGKNLTVVKTDDDVSSSSSQQFRPQMNQLVHSSFSHGYPHRPVIFSQYQNGSESNHFNGQPPVNMRSFMADRYCHAVPNMGPMVPPARSYNGYNGVHSQTPRGRNLYNAAASSSNPIKEIIIIDDSPENEADDSTRNDQFLRRNQFYTMNQSQGSDYHPYGGGPAVFRAGGFQTSSGMMHMGSSSPSPSNSTSHLRSSTAYYPPSYP
ncbi:uncharacterized protein LOC112504760 [Cynara cardunculus var. scolymus]|uniref:Hapless 8 n=1 Tax=Cynara cardunculus var. scolymus TaxID=59895 RepID=A0A118K688_CYNCS|nr:uncharacterized protein LOC112504760 [Cynara cardunculus var. scolymus]XP_024964489.1 uncharacterized protein LOC112504760 [Cynara cardunculus var. scolymus]XP_024964494.1 uncharacterized protein LOC112504760 [Cynara cardunculus var. scolymus]KVI10273.1 hypothetical protein Ccrd_011317 [Cynara cardunculus var. scolymus]